MSKAPTKTNKPLSNDMRRRLRRIGHVLHPVVTLGIHGLSENVIEETKRALNDHELIKVKIMGEDRDARHAFIQDLLTATGALLVQQVGKVILIYKLADERNMQLSNIVRFAHMDD